MTRDVKMPATVYKGASMTAYLKRTWMLYAMLLLPTAFFVIFRYIPMAYIWMAFSDFNIFRDLFDSSWVGFAHFQTAFAQHDFWPAFRNTIVLNSLDLIIGFPAPIILAILLSELKFKLFKRFTQTVLYMPHFLSWVVISSMMVQLFATNMGLVNNFFADLGLNRFDFLTTSWNWVGTYIGIGVWQSMGWGTIIYLAAISAIDLSLYEAAEIDGANRFQKIIHVTIPCIMPTVVILLILAIGGMVGIGFDRPFLMQNPTVMDRADVLSTLVFRRGIQTFQYSLATAISVFQSVINIFLLVSANFIARKLGQRGIY